jgi:hypothetical protein
LAGGSAGGEQSERCDKEGVQVPRARDAISVHVFSGANSD